MSEMSSSPEKRLPPAPGPLRGAPEVEGTSLAEYLGAIRRRGWLVAAAVAVSLGLAAYKNATTERLYASKAVLEIAEERGGGSSGGLAGIAASLGGGGTSLDSHAEVLRSRGVLGQVVDSLGLRLQRQVPFLWRKTFQPTGVVDGVHVAPDATAATLALEFGGDGFRVADGSSRAAAAYGEPVEIGGVRFTVPARPELEELTLWVIPRSEAVNVLLEHVKATPRPRTNLVDIVVTGYDPVVTERIANSSAGLYRLHSSRKSRSEAERRRKFVEEQLREGEALLAATQDRLTEHRKREELFSTRGQLVAGQAERNELELRRAELDAEMRTYRSLLSELQRSGRDQNEVIRTIMSSPGVAKNPIIMGLSERASKYESALDSLTAGPSRKAATHPDVRGVDSLLAMTRANLVRASRSHVEWLESQIRGLDAIIARNDSVTHRLTSAEPEELRLMLEVESYGEAVSLLREKYYTVGVADAAGEERVAVLDRALPGDLTGSGPGYSLVFGLIFGLMVGMGGAVALDSVNRSIRRRGDMERLLRVPELAVIPQVRGVSSSRRLLPLPRWAAQPRSLPGNGPEFLAGTQVHSAGAEAYRTLRTNLIFARNGTALRSLVVTSPAGSEGKTTTAANVAITFAQQGMRVLLVDCDVYRARLHRVFGVPLAPGLTELLQGTVTLEEAIRKSPVEGVSIVPAGPLPAVNPADLLGGDVMRSVLESLSDDFDLVVLDAPPVLTTAHATVLATQADGVLLVVRAGRTDRDSARDALQQLAGVGARILGAVLNDPDAALSHPKGYYDEARVADALRGSAGATARKA